MSAFETSSFVAADTPVTQRADQYATTLIAKLNGGQVFSQTFFAPFGDPLVQAGIGAADAVLAGDSAIFGSPFLASGSTSLQGSQLSHVQTGEQLTGNNQFTTADVFGPNFVIGCRPLLTFVTLSGGCFFLT